MTDADVFQNARLLVEQLLTLSTATIAFSVTFACRDGHVARGLPAKLWIAAWSAHAAAILFGLWALMGLTGVVAQHHRDIGGDLARDAFDTLMLTPIRLPALLQVLSFLAAMILTIAAGVKTISQPAANQSPEPPTS